MPESRICTAYIFRSDVGDPYDWDCLDCDVRGNVGDMVDIVIKAEDDGRGMINDDEIREMLPCRRRDQ